MSYTNDNRNFDDNGNILVSFGASSTSTASLVNGRKVTASAGTSVALATTDTCNYVVVTALRTNTDIVCIGADGVIAASGTRTGIPLSAGQSATIPVSDISHLFLDSVVDGEGVAFCYFK